MKLKSVLSYFVGIQIILLYFLPVIRTTIKIADITFGALSILSFISLIIMYKKIKWDNIGMFFIVFFAMCIFSLYNVITGVVSIADYIRGFIPFCWFIYYFIFASICDKKEINKLINIFYYMSLVFSVTVILVYIIYVLPTPLARVTYYYINSTLPFSMIALLIALYKILNSINIKRNCAFALIHYTAILLTETKSLLLSTIVAVVILLILTKQVNKGKKIKIVAMILAVLILYTSSMFQLLGVGKRWNMLDVNISLTDTTKYNDTISPSGANSPVAIGNVPETNKQIKIDIEDGDKGSFGVRIQEFKTAISQVKDNLFFGRGLGYKYDASAFGYGPDKVAYMHNVVAYFLLDFGLLGLIFLFIFFAFIVILYYKNAKSSSSDIHSFNFNAFAFSVIISLIIYMNFFAMIRSIHSNYILVLFLAALTSINKEYDIEKVIKV